MVVRVAVVEMCRSSRGRKKKAVGLVEVFGVVEEADVVEMEVVILMVRVVMVDVGRSGYG